MTAPRRFVISSVPRVGSNYLCALLNSLPEVLCHHELFNDQGVHLALDLRERGPLLGTQAERDADPLGFLERAWALALGRSVLGFKLAWRAPEPALAACLADPGIQKIVLDRDNRVKMFTSELVARAEWRWTYYDADPGELGVRRVAFDVEAFSRYNQTMDAFYDRVRGALAASGQPWLELRYEDLFEVQTHRRVLDFLAVREPPEALHSPTFKRNPQDLREILTNFEQTHAQLRGGPWEAQLLSTSL